MECQICHKKKLTSEYPSNPLSESCEHHHLLVCLRCIIKSVEESYACPVKDCGTMIDPDTCIGMWECKAKLKQLTFDYSERVKACSVAAGDAQNTASSGNIAVILTNLLGESHRVELPVNQTVDYLKQLASNHWKQQGGKGKIKLLYNGDDLQDKQTLQSAGLPSGCRIQVLFVLQELTPDLSEVRVSMSWGWPGGRDHTDYLDTACFTYSTQGGPAQFLHCIDFRTQRQQGRHQIGQMISSIYDNFVKHDGEARKSPTTKSSESSFTVWPQNLDRLRAPSGRFLHGGGGGRNQNLPTLPVTHLFFVIFTFRDTDIARFREPKLQVFDQRDPDTPLCSTQLNPKAKGLIVCLLSKPGRNGNWQVTEVGQSLTEGSVREYRPVANLCAQIVDRQMRVGQ